MNLLKNYKQVESDVTNHLKTLNISNSVTNVIANIAMVSIYDMMVNVYEVTLEHCGTVDPGVKIRDELLMFRNELLNKLIK